MFNLKFILSLCISFLLIFFMFLPMYLAGFCPIASATLTAIFIGMITAYLFLGFNSKASAVSISVSLSIILIAAVYTGIIFLTGGLHSQIVNKLYIYTDLTIFMSLGFLEILAINLSENLLQKKLENIDLKSILKSGVDYGYKISAYNTIIFFGCCIGISLVPIMMNFKFIPYFLIFGIPLIGLISNLACSIFLSLILGYFLLNAKK